MTQDCQQFAILTYHRILSTGREIISQRHASAGISMTLRQFERDLDLLVEYATVLPLSLALHCAAENSLPNLPVVITFDDGFKEHCEVVLPMLSARNLPATFFLCAQTSGQIPTLRWIDCVYALADLHPSSTTIAVAGSQIVFPGESGIRRLKLILRRLSPQEQVSSLRNIQQQLSVSDEALWEVARGLYLDWDEALKMATHRCATLGGHGSTHACLGNLSPQDAQMEVRDSYAAIRALISSDFIPFAYPFGGPDSFSTATEAIVSATGFSCACSNIPGLNSTGSIYNLRRLDVCRFPVESTLRLLENHGGETTHER